MTVVYGKRYEDYIKVIHKLEKEKGVVRLKDVAEALGLKPPTVLQYINKLSKNGIIEYSKGEIRLTEKGREMAERIERQYKILKQFLTDVLGIPEDVAAVEACYAEHGFSEETIERLETLIDIMKNDEKCKEILERLTSGGSS